MKATAELNEFRHKDPKVLVTELERERLQLARDRIAVRLGKFSKIHELTTRKARVARMLTVLSEKLRTVPVATVQSPSPAKKRSAT